MKKWRLLAPVAALAAVAVVAVSLAGTGAAAPTAGYKAGLVSDVGRFNDKGFNQLQLKTLNSLSFPGEVQEYVARGHRVQ